MAKLTEQEIRALAELYLAARERLLDTILNHKGVGTKTYANTIYSQLQRELRRLQRESTGFVNTAVPREYREGLQATYRYFHRHHLRMRNPAAFASLHTDAVYEISREMQFQIDSGLAQVGRQVMRYVDLAQDQALRLAGLRQAGIKTASGGTVQDMRSALLEELRDKGFLTVQYGEGTSARQVPVDVYASMVARATSREAGNTARLNQLTANGYDLVRMSEHHPTCGVCAALQGRVYSISGKDTRFPPLSRAFGAYNNVHPNCRHVIVPWVEALKTPEEVAKAVAFSNRPFEDSREADEVALYNAQQNKNRRSRNTLYQYERYKQRLGAAAPKTWMAFSRMKKAGGADWEALQGAYRKAGLRSGKAGDTDGYTSIDSVADYDYTETEQLLEDFAQRYRDAPVEHALVLSPSGRAYRLTGYEAGVNTELVGAEELAGSTLIHNHPPRDADSFSVEDFMFHMSSNVAQQEVVFAGHRHSMRYSGRLLDADHAHRLYQQARRSVLEKALRGDLEIVYEQWEIMKVLGETLEGLVFYDGV